MQSAEVYGDGEHFFFFTRFPSVDEKLLLLDVGSCFNPFAMYEDINPVSIDLQPADSVSLVFVSIYSYIDVIELA